MVNFYDIHKRQPDGSMVSSKREPVVDLPWGGLVFLKSLSAEDRRDLVELRAELKRLRAEHRTEEQALIEVYRLRAHERSTPHEA